MLKKWLSYRDVSLIDRPLTVNEAIEFATIARRLTAIVALDPLLDDNYIAARDNAFDWIGDAAPTPPVVTPVEGVRESPRMG